MITGNIFPGYAIDLVTHLANQNTKPAEKPKSPDNVPMMQNLPPKPKPSRSSLVSLGRGFEL
ncbi:hypothetical protein ASE80_22485 [Pseudomonas sp. Leaf15]|jgi:hypothetical protein|uniref:hypothetical protein n=1 Tax=unclassified Pseudomonas TaxID=196821 RepID=UPI000702D0C8|nr:MULTISPECIES: hypothetical protein [unclassified Pseudomonas]KQM54205.1 hypothetical protein ASE80_22485 [Pseudomonas sp. Leaf15]RAH00168.1 hypothetical protein DJ480_23795 [Pseudomonas sp. Leaf98]